MLIAHGAIGVLASRAVLKKNLINLSIGKSISLDILAFLFGILPDFDFFMLAAQSKPAFLHHSLVTHTPIFWIITSLLLNLVLKLVQKTLNSKTLTILSDETIHILSFTFLISTLSHIVADLFSGHLMLFYPLTTRGFTLFANIIPISQLDGYFSHPFFVIEILIIIAFIKYLTDSYLKKAFQRSFIPLYITGTIIFALSLYNYSNKYVLPVKIDKTNTPIYDEDHDWIIDSKDYDSNNNGLNNLEDVEDKVLSNKIKEIIDSKKSLPTYPGSMVFISYQSINKSIPPVIWDYQFKESNIIDKNLVSIDQLYDYCNDNCNPAMKEGSIVFLIDKNEKILNAGIALDKNCIAIVLDKNIDYLKTKEEIRKFYKDIEVSFKFVQSYSKSLNR